MSKDFEKAYRELAESEIPDLWDRIEAGLESKTTPEQTKESGTGKSGEETEGNRAERNQTAGKEIAAPDENRRRKIKAMHISRYSGIAAAVVCVAVIIPAAVFLFRNRPTEGYSGGAEVTEGIDTAAAADETMEFAAEDAEAADEPESCEAAAEEMDAGTGGLEEADNSAPQMADEADVLKKESLSSAKQESAPREAETEETGVFAEAAEESTVFEHVEIKVTEIEIDFEREDKSPPGTLYTVTVQKDASGGLKEGEELVVDVPAYSSYALVKDGVFEVDLVYKENGTYGLEKCYRQIEE